MMAIRARRRRAWGVERGDVPVGTFPKDDCDDTRPAVHGGQSLMVEYSTCDAIDNDCDLSTTELTRPEGCGSDGYCSAGGICRRRAAVVQVAAGAAHSCARRADGSVQCWGDNQFGQLGDGTTIARSVPTPVLGLSGVVDISAGRQHTCARLGDGTADAGNNAYAALVMATTTANRLTPTVVGISGVIDIAGGEHSCALMNDGTVRCCQGH
ncbi:MAG: hypothetical protein IPF99_35665 [Deltaproteobacteria bacterium]|nr:hypothetical protein [Deltaproteobacteria bacterium]